MKGYSYFFNGKIYTLNSADAIASSILVKDGRISALDADEKAIAAIRPAVTRVDLKGGVVFPGFIDSHLHIASLGRVSRSFADLYQAHSVEEIVERLKVKATARTRGTVTGYGPNFRADLLAEGRLPGAADLDRVADDRPVIIHDVNKYIVNSFVLDCISPEDRKKAINTEKGENENVFFGKMRELVPGKCQEPPSRDKQLEDDICRGIDLCVTNGITSVINASVTLEQCRVLRRLNQQGKIPLKMVLLMFKASPKELAAEGIFPGLVEGRLTFGPLKYFWDMFVMHKSAWMYEPYSWEPSNCGMPFMPPAEFRKILVAAFDAGWPVAVHCTGDRALDELTQMLEAEKNRMAGLPASHIIHAYFPSQRAMDICRDLNVGLAVQPAFIRDWGDTLPDLINAKRASRFLPLSTMLENGLTIGAGSDAPIVRLSPVADIATAMLRRTAGGRSLDDTECLRAEEALWLYTTGAAALTGRESELGSIETGKSADFTVLDRDIRALPVSDIAATKVLMTVVDECAVYESNTMNNISKKTKKKNKGSLK